MQTSKPVITQGWLRAIIFFIFLSGIVYLLSAATDTFISPWLLKDKSAVFARLSKGLWIGVLVSFAASIGTVWVFRKLIDRQTVRSLGFRWKGNSRYAFTGAFAAIAMIGLATLLLMGMNYLHFTGWNADPVALISSAIVMLLVAVSEELVFRGYLLNNLMQSTNQWVALAVTSVLFAAVHISNPGAGVLPVSEVFIGGLMLGINYIYTRNLWFGIFLHFAWNFFQGPVFGYKVSGISIPAAMQQDLSGPAWLSGGAFGLEGSVVAIILNLLLIGVLAAVYNRKNKHSSRGNGIILPSPFTIN